MLRSDVAVSGGRLAIFELAGGDGLPLVLAVHGITANSHAWIPVARELEGRARVIAPDIRGRGRSGTLPPPYGMAAHAEDLLTVLDALGAERAILLGHSLGAYIVARLAVEHPERVSAAVLVDGGLTLPDLASDVDPQTFVEAFLGPALARLSMSFASREAYFDWWRAHPAMQHGLDDGDLVAYAGHDLSGEPGEWRSSVSEPAVRGDAGELFEMGEPAHRMSVPATLLRAPRGLLDEPNPMQPADLVDAWVAEAPAQRDAAEVPDVNHYSITLGRAGARAVAEAVLRAAAPPSAT